MTLVEAEKLVIKTLKKVMEEKKMRKIDSDLRQLMEKYAEAKKMIKKLKDLLRYQTKKQ